MSYRNEDPGIIDMLRNMGRRLDRLERGDKGVRQNDVRLGDVVLSTDASSNSILFQNLKTGNKEVFQNGTQPVRWITNLDISVDNDFVVGTADEGSLLVFALTSGTGIVTVTFPENTNYKIGSRFAVMTTMDPADWTVQVVFPNQNFLSSPSPSGDSLKFQFDVGRVELLGNTGLFSGTPLKDWLTEGFCPGVTSTTVTVTATGSAGSFVVPAGITSISVEMAGASGSGINGISGNSNNTLGGRGAKWTGTITVTPGETLHLQVGQRSGFPDGGAGGAASGTNSLGGFHGGGSTRIWRTAIGTTLIVVAGAGGGGARNTGSSATLGTRAGEGGIDTPGSAGINVVVTALGTANAGLGASAVAGGAAGSPGTTSLPTAGASLAGGVGGVRAHSSSLQHVTGGGGGGGGYFGGGGGGVVVDTSSIFSNSAGSAQGGGGSSFADSGLSTTTAWAHGVDDTEGYITITYLTAGGSCCRCD